MATEPNGTRAESPVETGGGGTGTDSGIGGALPTGSGRDSAAGGTVTTGAISTVAVVVCNVGDESGEGAAGATKRISSGMRASPGVTAPTEIQVASKSATATWTSSDTASAGGNDVGGEEGSAIAVDMFTTLGGPKTKRAALVRRPRPGAAMRHGPEYVDVA